jgi:hypothetical protein
MELSLSQKFEVARFKQTIESTENIDAVKGLCNQLVSAWFSQKAACEHLIRETLAQSQELDRQRQKVETLKALVPETPDFEVPL